MRPLARIALVSALVVVALTSLPRAARADVLPAGALGAQVLIEPGGHVGGGLLLDVLQPLGMLRLGFAMGVTAIPSDNSDGRVYVPLLASGALVLGHEGVSLALRLRGGAWAGAVKSGLAGGGMLMAGVHLRYGTDERVAFTLGVDLVREWGHGDRVFWAPTLGLAWALGSEDAP
ncbi:MAG: hypothetical protein GW913_14980 [Myxococcales bacterium]|nr:hypothetical protein [Myxococcales bacterium]